MAKRSLLSRCPSYITSNFTAEEFSIHILRVLRENYVGGSYKSNSVRFCVISVLRIDCIPQ